MSTIPHRPRKRFGQHFLHNRQVLDQLVATIAPQITDHLVEIGPGQGALTERLLERSAHLDVIEIDRDLAAALQLRWTDRTRLRVHCGDALTCDYSALAVPGDIRVVGNLPYNVSTPLLFHLFTQLAVIRDMHFMLQEEVVDRMVAYPGSKIYGRLSVMCQFYCQVEKLFDVAPGAFFPVPKVMSAVVRLIPRPAPSSEVCAARLGQIVTLAFSQRRKTLRNTLKSLFDEATLLDVDIDPTLRAEALPVDAFLRLARLPVSTT